MVNHSNLLDFKQKNEVVMVSWDGSPSPPLFGFQEVEWGILRLLRLALVAVLLASESLPCPPRPLSYSIFPSTPFAYSTWKLHGPLCVCVHVCACIYMYREIYMWGQGEGGGAAQGLQPGHCPLEPVICPFCVSEIKVGGF
jgi:hypothetical protein